jgi:ubiquinone/menaquinone biosynthesis C-methylase UbiE
VDYFKNKASEWDTPIKMEMAEKFVKELLKNYTPGKDQKMMDYGCGTGLVGMELSKLTRDVVYLDSSESMLKILKQKLGAIKDFSKSIIHGEIHSYNQKDIDLITTLMALHHVEDIESALNHISANILKPSGVMVIGDLKEEDGSFHNGEEIPHKGFNTEKLTAQLQKAGLKVEKTYIYNTLTKKEKTYEQFIMIATKNNDEKATKSE